MFSFTIFILCILYWPGIFPFVGFGCDDKKVIEILGHRNYAQRHELRQAYKSLYSDDLRNRLKSELWGNFERAMLLWMEDAAERDAIIIRDTVKGWGTKDLALIELICTRTGSQLQAIRLAYNTRFQRSLDEDIISDMSGDYKELLLAYLNNYRPETPHVDMHLAQADCRELFKAGEGRLGTDESAIIAILSTRSSAQLNACFNMYKQIYGHDLEKAMKWEAYGNFLNALRLIIKCVHYPAKYFAKVFVAHHICAFCSCGFRDKRLSWFPSLGLILVFVDLSYSLHPYVHIQLRTWLTAGLIKNPQIKEEFSNDMVEGAYRWALTATMTEQHHDYSHMQVATSNTPPHEEEMYDENNPLKWDEMVNLASLMKDPK